MIKLPKDFDSSRAITVIYHKNCADGFGAAYACWCEFGGWANYVAVSHGDITELSEQSEHSYLWAEKRVYIVDFSFDLPVMEYIKMLSSRLVVLDHHKTAVEKLASLVPRSSDCFEFDMERSGAVIAWEHFNRGPVPQILLHIQDRDLWKFKLEGTKQIQAAIFSYPYDFLIWREWMLKPDSAIPELANIGYALDRKHTKDIEELLEAGAKIDLWLEGLNSRVVGANLPYIYSSEAGHILQEKYLQPIGACFWQKGSDSYVFSLRSCDFGPDVSKIAKHYGGGGHRNAAGFEVNTAAMIQIRGQGIVI